MVRSARSAGRGASRGPQAERSEQSIRTHHSHTGLAQLAERRPPKPKVRGSIPWSGARHLDVAKWSKAAACKAAGAIPHPFESDRRVQCSSPIAQLAERLAVSQEVRGCAGPARGLRPVAAQRPAWLRPAEPSHVGEPTQFHLGVAQMAARVIWDHEAAGSRPATETSVRRVLGCGRSSMAELWAVIPRVPVRLRPATPKHMRTPCVANSSGRVPAS